MLGGQLTQREAEIIRQLLAEHDITTYEIIEVTNEGKELPGSAYDDEIEQVLGVIATPTKVYMFVLDWVDGSYTLGEKNGFWRELPLDELGHDKDHIVESQRRLREKASF